MRRYLREDLLEMIRVCADARRSDGTLRRGRLVRLRDVNKRFGVSETPFRRVFGSFGEAVAEAVGAGVDESGLARPRKWSRELLLSRAKSVIEPGEEITLHAFCKRAAVSTPTVAEYWGTWQELRDAAGGRPPRKARAFSREWILERFRDVVAEHGDVSLLDFQRLAGVSATTVNAYWKLPELRQAVGLPRKKYGGPVCDDDELVDDYLRLWRMLGRQPSRNDINVLGKFSYAAYRARWHNGRAIREAIETTLRERHRYRTEVKQLIEAEGPDVNLGPVPRPPVVAAKRATFAAADEAVRLALET